MESAWIKIFVLTLAECVAPPGKTVCQESQFELEFLARADCEAALQQFIALKEASPNVIVDKRASNCRPSASEQPVYATLAEVSESVDAAEKWREPATEPDGVIELRQQYDERLARLKSCDETGGAAPCKVGQIIVEDTTGEPVDVWRSDN